jgi:hypothetical protein
MENFHVNRAVVSGAGVMGEGRGMGIFLHMSLCFSCRFWPMAKKYLAPIDQNHSYGPDK